MRTAPGGRRSGSLSRAEGGASCRLRGAARGRAGGDPRRRGRDAGKRARTCRASGTGRGAAGRRGGVGRWARSRARRPWSQVGGGERNRSPGTPALTPGDRARVRAARGADPPPPPRLLGRQPHLCPEPSAGNFLPRSSSRRRRSGPPTSWRRGGAAGRALRGLDERDRTATRAPPERRVAFLEPGGRPLQPGAFPGPAGHLESLPAAPRVSFPGRPGSGGDRAALLSPRPQGRPAARAQAVPGRRGGPSPWERLVPSSLPGMGWGGEGGSKPLEPQCFLSGQPGSEKPREHGTLLPFFSCLISQASAWDRRAA